MHIKAEMHSVDAAGSLHSDSRANGDGNDSSAVNGRGESEASTSAKSREKRKIADSLIQNCKDANTIVLDLNKRELQIIPEELTQLAHLEYLYLEGNNLTWLPENFFDCLPNLVWLDLRNNYLQSIPSAYIGRHKKLKNLLLQGNQIRSLPLELGLVRTLTGLSLSNNPIEFPPQEVLEKGCHIVLAFLRETLKGKALGRIPPVPNIADLHLTDPDGSSEEDWSSHRSKNSSHCHRSRRMKKSTSNHDLTRTNSIDSDLIGPVPHSASLQHRTSYGEIKTQQHQKFKKSGTVGSRTESDISGSSTGKKKLTKLSRYPEPPPPERVEKTYMEEKRLAHIREMKEKQEMVLQRRRDQEALKEWRDEGKRKQVEKYREKMIKGKLDYEEPAKKAPFGIDEDKLRVMSNKERIAHDVREKHEKMRRILSPATKQKMERIRMERDRELERRLKEHTMQMQERRRQPKGTPQEEMVAAKKELEIAEQLRKELEQRRKNLEYRFTAFTGDLV